jgi:transposase-like protein
MGNIKRFHTPSFKSKVALDLIRESDSIVALCSRHSIHPTQANRWKQQVLSGLESLFSEKASDQSKEKDRVIEELYKSIGQLKVELDWLKKKMGTS